jgi:hypothetical protein
MLAKGIINEMVQAPADENVQKNAQIMVSLYLLLTKASKPEMKPNKELANEKPVRT